MVQPLFEEQPLIGYDDEEGEYIDLETGEYIALAIVLSLLEDRMEIGLDTLFQMLQNAPDLDIWEEAFRIELRRAHLQAAALGKGGWAQLDADDLARVENQLRFEYQQLARFVDQIRNEELSIAQIQVRIKMYADHIWTSFWDARTQAKKSSGFRQERRILQAQESCPDCVDYAARGWVPVGSLPEPGQQSVCGANCRCYKEYRRTR